MNEQKIIDQINFYIMDAVNHYKQNDGKFDETHKINMSRINGMIDVLAMITGKSYKVTEGGLLEA